MRKLLILITLMLVVVGMFQLSRLAGRWHYVVSAPAGELIYATSFDGVMPDWSQDTRSGFSYIAQEGVLRMEIAPDATGAGQHGIANWSAYLADFDIHVKARLLEGVFDGSHNNGYGVVFRHYDSDNYYLFILSNDGSYRLIRVLNGRIKIMSDWIWTDAIVRDINAVNQLRVVGKGDSFRFYLNDTLLQLCIPDSPDGTSTFDLNGNCMGTMQTTLIDPSIAFGRVGVGVDLDRGQQEGFVVAFDEVLIFAPSATEEGDA